MKSDGSTVGVATLYWSPACPPQRFLSYPLPETFAPRSNPMEAHHMEQCVEVRGVDQCRRQREEEAVNEERIPLLVAYADAALSIEAAEELVRLSEDATIAIAVGEDL